jgi:hypothetical protein
LFGQPIAINACQSAKVLGEPVEVFAARVDSHFRAPRADPLAKEPCISSRPSAAMSAAIVSVERIVEGGPEMLRPELLKTTGMVTVDLRVTTTTPEQSRTEEWVMRRSRPHAWMAIGMLLVDIVQK